MRCHSKAEGMRNLSCVPGVLPASKTLSSASMKCHHGCLLPHQDPLLLLIQALHSHPPRPKEPPQRLWTPQPVPCTGHLWGQGMVLCTGVVKGSDLSSAVLEAKSFNLL